MLLILLFAFQQHFTYIYTHSDTSGAPGKGRSIGYCAGIYDVDHWAFSAGNDHFAKSYQTAAHHNFHQYSSSGNNDCRFSI
jgi:hypothetical protein